MKFLTHMRKRWTKMFQIGKNMEMDCKFLVITFFICLIPIGLTSIVDVFNAQGNMVTLRTMFSAIWGYLIENISNPNNKGRKISKEKRITLEQKALEEEEKEKEDQKPAVEMRVLIAGHVLFFIILVLIVGGVLNVDQNNLSLILLKNTGFSCIGFLISATKANKANR